MRQNFSAVLAARAAHSGPEVLTAGPWHITLDAAPASVHRQEGLTAVLKGQLYDLDLADLLRLYRQHGPNFPRFFDGSFSLLILDEALGTVLAVTDRMGSHKLYAAHDGERVTLSTLPDHPDFVRRPYHPAALASLLTSGAVLNDLSLYQGVQSLTAAHLHDIRPGGIRSQPYWQLLPPEGLDTRAEPELREECAELLQRAVRRRVERLRGPVHLSLSGGYDSRGLLSLLAATGREVRTFSYYQGTRRADGDATVADALAAQYGARHEHVQAYGGDLLATLRRNAIWGHGMTKFCDEVDAWQTLAAQNVSDVFVGDVVHAVHHLPLPDMAEQFARWEISPFASLGKLATAFAPTACRALETAWTAEIDQMSDGIARYGNPRQQEYLLRSQQRVTHVLLPWRERFTGHAAAVHMPYLDGAILEFIHRLPPTMLAGKRLVNGALQRLDSDIYRVPLARSSGYVTDWHSELIRHREAIREELLCGSSQLDELIEPQAIEAVLDSLSAQESVRSRRMAQVRRTLGTIRRSRAGQKILGRARVKHQRVSPAIWLLRVLTLRVADLERQRRS
ncbi:asparagine synthase-related protein [Deinococcus humi]|uniref:asparagine synthase (glutamine-hydrolyzing) n=1 Tax=Deinococcus humi TaxID=662880 RepID=A0A7W8K2E1_9DEIO|nr:asparagine synthase-related protein [Deinococcus humi]MBB5366266.1 asparagine synthase (glutamine-hydrolyzing) [Deinococcus humi]GGO41732.1 hypothetical protein GCM10008949_52910 [Deinococcus humi]